MASVASALLYPFDYSGSQGSSNALIKSDQDPLKKGASKVIRALLFPCSLATYKQMRNIMRMGSASMDDSKVQTSERPISKPQAAKATQQQENGSKNLQTKNIQKITRNDLINGTYDLNPNPVRRSNHNSRGQHHQRRRRHHRRRQDGEVPQHTTSRKSTSSSSKSPTPTSPTIANIDDDFEQNEMFMAAQEQIRNDQLTKAKRASDSDVFQIHHRHTNDGMLNVPVQRSITLESDISDYDA